MRPGAVAGAASQRDIVGEAGRRRIGVVAGARIGAVVGAAGIGRRWGLGGRRGVDRSCRAIGGTVAWGLGEC